MGEGEIAKTPSRQDAKEKARWGFGLSPNLPLVSWRLGALAVLFSFSFLSTFLPARHHEDTGAGHGPNARVRVGLVFDVGGRGDKSFNDAAYRGLTTAQKELGVSVEYLEPASSED